MWLIKNIPKEQPVNVKSYLSSQEKMKDATAIELYKGKQFSRINYNDVSIQKELIEKDVPSYNRRILYYPLTRN